MRLLRAAIVSLILLASTMVVAFEPIEGTEVMLFDRSGQTLLGYGRILGGMLRLEVTGLNDSEAAREFLMVVASSEGEVLTVPASLDEAGQLFIQRGETDPELLTAVLAEGSVGLEIFSVPQPEFARGDPGEGPLDIDSEADDPAPEDTTEVAEPPADGPPDGGAAAAAEPGDGGSDQGAGVAGGGAASTPGSDRPESPPGQEKRGQQDRGQEDGERGPPDDRGNGPPDGEAGKSSSSARNSKEPSDREAGPPDDREPGSPAEGGEGRPDNEGGGGKPEGPGQGKGKGQDR